MKKITLLLLVLIFMGACKEESKKEEMPSPNAEFGALLDNYYEDGLKLNPITATLAGDHRYDDSFPNVLSDTYKAEEKAYYESYKNKLPEFPDETLTESEQMSKAILEWECDINLAEFNYNADLTPIDQMWSQNHRPAAWAHRWRAPDAAGPRPRCQSSDSRPA